MASSLSGRRRAGVLTAALVVALIAVPSAGAKTFKSGFASYVVKQVSAAADGSVVPIADCPTPRRVSGGGAVIGGPVVATSPYSHIAGIQPQEANHRIIAELYNDSAGSVPARSIAACIAPNAGGQSLSYIAQASPFNPFTGNSGSGTVVTCPGSRAIGGGIAITGTAAEEWVRGSGFQVMGNGKVDRSNWRTSFNVQGSQQSPHNVFSHAICYSGNQLRIRYLYRFKVLLPGQAGAARVTCPRNGGKGWKVLSGGWRGFTAAVLASHPFDNRDKGKAPEDGWRVRTLHFPGGDPQALTVFAVCAKRK